MIVIYALRCPLANTVRYIGKTKYAPEARLRAHICAARAGKQHYCARWIRTVLAHGLLPTVDVLHVVGANERWQDVEVRFIAEYREAGFPLTNLARGGEGLKECDPEVISRMRESLRKYYADPVQRARLLEQRRKSAKDPAVQERHRNARIKWLAQPAVRKKMSEDAKKQAQRLGAQEALSAAGKAAWSSPTPQQLEARKAAVSLTQRQKFSDPEVRAMRLAKMHSPEATAKAIAKRAVKQEETSVKLRAAWVRRRAAKQLALGA